MAAYFNLKEFYVPVGFILEFAFLMERHDIKNSIVSADINDEAILVYVDYDENKKSEQKIIDKISKKVDDYQAKADLYEKHIDINGTSDQSKQRRLEQFYVPVGYIKRFARLMQNYQFENMIAGIEGDDLVIFVSYSFDEQGVIDEIHNKIEQYINDQINDKWKLNGVKK